MPGRRILVVEVVEVARRSDQQQPGTCLRGDFLGNSFSFGRCSHELPITVACQTWNFGLMGQRSRVEWWCSSVVVCGWLSCVGVGDLVVVGEVRG